MSLHEYQVARANLRLHLLDHGPEFVDARRQRNVVQLLLQRQGEEKRRRQPAQHPQPVPPEGTERTQARGDKWQ